MHNLFRQGAFQGTTPREAYLVKCDTRDDDAERHQPRHRQHPRRLRAAQAGRVRGHPGSSRWPARSRPEGGGSHGAVHASTPQRFDPYKNFKFRVKWDGRYVAGVSKVSALKRTTEVVKHREGGDPSSSRKSPGRTEYEAITLERGVTHDAEFEQWANKVWNFGAGLGAEVSLKDFRKDLIIEVYNEAGQLAIAYKVFRCWVSEFQALPDLDANANAVAIQHIKLENEGWERDVDVVEPSEPTLHRAAVGTCVGPSRHARLLDALGAHASRQPADRARCCCAACRGADDAGRRGRGWTRRRARRGAVRPARRAASADAPTRVADCPHCGERARDAARRCRSCAGARTADGERRRELSTATRVARAAADAPTISLRVRRRRRPDGGRVALLARCVASGDARRRRARRCRRVARRCSARALRQRLAPSIDDVRRRRSTLPCVRARRRPTCRSTSPTFLLARGRRLGAADCCDEVHVLAAAYGWSETRDPRAQRRAPARLPRAGRR